MSCSQKRDMENAQQVEQLTLCSGSSQAPDASRECSHSSWRRVAMAGFVNSAVWENTAPEVIKRKGTQPGGAFSCIPWEHIFLICFLLRRQGRLVFSNWAVFGDIQLCKKPLFCPLTSMQPWALDKWASAAQEPVIEHRRCATDFTVVQIF